MSADACQPEWLEFLDHTADIGIRVRAADPRELFARSAWALFAVIGSIGRVRPAAEWPIRVEATDPGALLIRWLSELNYLHQTRHVMLCAFDVQELTDTALAAHVRGEAIRPEHEVARELKAVTFHGLELAHDAGGWRAQIIFDV